MKAIKAVFRRDSKNGSANSPEKMESKTLASSISISTSGGNSKQSGVKSPSQPAVGDGKGEVGHCNTEVTSFITTIPPTSQPSSASSSEAMKSSSVSIKGGGHHSVTFSTSQIPTPKVQQKGSNKVEEGQTKISTTTFTASSSSTPGSFLPKKMESSASAMTTSIMIPSNSISMDSTPVTKNGTGPDNKSGINILVGENNGTAALKQDPEVLLQLKTGMESKEKCVTKPGSTAPEPKMEAHVKMLGGSHDSSSKPPEINTSVKCSDKLEKSINSKVFSDLSNMKEGQKLNGVHHKENSGKAVPGVISHETGKPGKDEPESLLNKVAKDIKSIMKNVPTTDEKASAEKSTVDAGKIEEKKRELPSQSSSGDKNGLSSLEKIGEGKVQGIRARSRSRESGNSNNTTVKFGERNATPPLSKSKVENSATNSIEKSRNGQHLKRPSSAVVGPKEPQLTVRKNNKNKSSPGRPRPVSSTYDRPTTSSTLKKAASPTNLDNDGSVKSISPAPRPLPRSKSASSASVNSSRQSFRTKKLNMGDAEPGAGDVKKEEQKPATFKEQFAAFSRFGDASSDGKQISLSNSDKWMKQAHVIDGKKVTTTDTSITFKKLFKNAKKVAIEDYKKFLEDLCKSKNLNCEEIQEKLTKCGAPGLSTSTRAAHKGVVERLTDTSKYTGSHKERFDATGKGKGIQGRRDVADNSGYTSSFKSKQSGCGDSASK